MQNLLGQNIEISVWFIALKQLLAFIQTGIYKKVKNEHCSHYS